MEIYTLSRQFGELVREPGEGGGQCTVRIGRPGSIGATKA
jgi:hypothetical protein